MSQDVLPKHAVSQDDRLTVIAVAALACILQDVLHEGVGHGLASYVLGAHTITLSTVAEDSDITSQWIDAAGTLVNLAAAAGFYLALRVLRGGPTLRLFLVLCLAGNLFTGTGYFLFSGVFGFGDWQQVIRGFEPAWIWRLGLVLVGAASYFAAMRLVASEFTEFARGTSPRRIRTLAWLPYLLAGPLAFVAGLRNPAGIFFVFASALPSTLGANAGLWNMPGMVRKDLPGPGVARIDRSWAWIAAGVLACAVFVLVLGRGVTWRR